MTFHSAATIVRHDGQDFQQEDEGGRIVKSSNDVVKWPPSSFLVEITSIFRERSAEGFLDPVWRGNSVPLIFFFFFPFSFSVRRLLSVGRALKSRLIFRASENLRMELGIQFLRCYSLFRDLSALNGIKLISSIDVSIYRREESFERYVSGQIHQNS